MTTTTVTAILVHPRPAAAARPPQPQSVPRARPTSRLVPMMYGDQLYFVPGTPSRTPSPSPSPSPGPQGPPQDDLVVRFFTWLGRLLGGQP